MKHALLALLIAASVLPASALAKAPSAASIDGPGSSGGITFEGDEATGPLGALTEEAGFFPAVFGQDPNPMLTGKPKGELGRKFTITYTVPGPSNEGWKIHQDVYPYAASGPVTYMEPGQKIFDTQTGGGWFQADPALKQTLVSAGLPNAPSARAQSSSSSEFPTTLVGLLTAALLLLTTTALVARRRTRAAAA